MDDGTSLFFAEKVFSLGKYFVYLHAETYNALGYEYINIDELAKLLDRYAVA